MEIACIIEGNGEENAVPVLLRRLIKEIDPALFVRVSRPSRYPKGRLKKQGHLAAALESVARRLSQPGAVLILVDADDDCPVTLGRQLLDWATQTRRDIPTSVVIANREYEAWFLAAAESLSGHRCLRDNVTPPPDCDAIRGAKRWLEDRAATRERYDPVDHQASLSQRMDLDLARQNSRSFRKLDKEIRRLVEAIRPPEA